MKLLLDNNLSPRLIQRIADVFPDAEHVARIGLADAPDVEVWAFAATEGFNIVTKDADFNELVVLRGFPPRVVWLRLGNCTTKEVEDVLRRHVVAVDSLGNDETTGILILGH